MRIKRETLLDCKPSRARCEQRRSILTEYVCHPLLTFRPVAPTALPAVWAGGEYLMQLRLWNLLPLGYHRMEFRPDDKEDSSLPPLPQVRSVHRGSMLKLWQEIESIEPSQDGRARLVETIHIQAGWLSPLAWLFAKILSQHRQKRWRRLVAGGFNYFS